MLLSFEGNMLLSLELADICVFIVIIIVAVVGELMRPQHVAWKMCLSGAFQHLKGTYRFVCAFQVLNFCGEVDSSYVERGQYTQI